MNLTNIPLTKDISHNQDSRVVPHQVAMKNPPNLVPWFFPLLHCFSAGQPDTLQMLTLQFTSLSSHGLGRRCWRFLERNCDRFIGSCKKCRLLLGITYTLYIYDTHNLYVYTVYQRHIRRTKYCVPFDFPLPSLLRTKFSRYLSLVLRKHEETPLKKT